MKIHDISKVEKKAVVDGKEFSPLNAPASIDVYSLIEDVLNLHFKDDTLQAEESDIGIRLQDYGFYDLKLVNISGIRDVKSVEEAPVNIEPDNVDDNMAQILATRSYPPIVLDVIGHVIDGYHRVFALKKIGCKQVWAYVPNKKTYNDPQEANDEDLSEDDDDEI